MNKINLCFMLLSATLLLSSCSDKEDNGALPQNHFYDNGVFIVNEGVFQQGNSSVSFFNPANSTLTEDAFGLENARPLGDVAQSVSRSGNRLYIVVNNSQKVEVVNRVSFSSLATIAGLSSPRYMLEVTSSKIYISDWGSNSLKIILNNGDVVSGSIPTGTGPEQMLLFNNKVYVANVGGFGSDSTVTIINAVNDQVISTLNVGINPNSLVLDANNKIWILCAGSIGTDFTPGTFDDIEGKLIRIDPATDGIEAIFNMAQSEHPLKLTINQSKTDLFYLMSSSSYDGSIYRMNISSPSLPLAGLVNKNFYGLGIHPLTGDIYGGYSPVFGQKGYMFRYQFDGILIDSVKVGIGPNGFYFNY